MTRTTDKPVTFRNDQGRIHAGVQGEDFTKCGRIKRNRNRYTVIPGPKTVTCGECLSQMDRADHVHEAFQKLDALLDRREMAAHRVAGFAVRSNPRVLESATFPGVVWPV
jgi:hypothetical protein